MSQYALIIVNWNSWDILSRCLDKLQAQTCQNFKVLLIDNASDAPVPSNLLLQHPNVTLIQNQSNLGFAAANNQALKLLDDTEWVVLLNPDAFPEPDWLAQLINAHEKYPDYAMFGSRQLKEDKSDILDGDGDAYHMSGLVWREGHGKCVGDAVREPWEVFSPCAAAGLYKKEALLSAGGFDEDFFCYVEDVDLGFRLRLMGHRCLLVPSAVVHHSGSATTGGQQSDFAIYHGHRNLVWAYVKNMPSGLFWLCLPLHLTMNLLIVGMFVMRGKGRIIFRAKYHALLGLPQMWRKRKTIQQNRQASSGEIWRQLNKQINRARCPKKHERR